MFFKKSYLDKIKNIPNEDKLNDLIFFVTSRCNSRCRTCFLWRSLNKGQDLSLNEIIKISQFMPTFDSLLISGGEPFLRDDLSEIVRIFYKNNKIRLLGIPTNGLLTQKIIESTKKILKGLPDATISINFSLDGLSKTHDYIRGVPGNFEKSLVGIKALCELRRTFPNLEVRINTVICQANFNEILDLAEFIFSNFNVDGHYFELIRGESPDREIQQIPKDQLEALYRGLIRIQSKSFFKRNRSRGFLYGHLNYFIYLSRLLFLYRTQLDVYLAGIKWPMPCLAGRTSFVLGSQGELSACELRKNIANIKDFNYDFKKFWNSRTLRQERGQVAKDRCDCTHVCFIDASFSHHLPTLFLKLPVLYLKYQFFHSL